MERQRRDGDGEVNLWVCQGGDNQWWIIDMSCDLVDPARETKLPVTWMAQCGFWLTDGSSRVP